MDNYGNKKPSHSYADLIRMAITSTDSKRMTLSEIYDFVGMYFTTQRTTPLTIPYYTILRYLIQPNLEPTTCTRQHTRPPTTQLTRQLYKVF